jgi:RNA polymerase primary sigma factor
LISTENKKINYFSKSFFSLSRNFYICNVNQLNKYKMKHHSFQQSVTGRNEVVDAYLSEIGKISPISADEEKMLCARILNGGDERARQRFVEGNLKFVVSVAKQYQGAGLELMDLINEGNVGLVKASQYYDPNTKEKYNDTGKNVRFISFAVWWIRQAIMEAIKEKGRMVKLPLNQINAQRKLSKEMDQIMKEQGYTSIDLAAASLGVDASKYQSQSSVSLSTPIGEEDFTLGDTLSDGTVSDAGLEKLSFIKQIATVLNTLEERESFVISNWFGVNGTSRRGKDEIAKDLGISEERVEQIYHKAIRKLKASNRSRLLKPFVS